MWIIIKCWFNFQYVIGVCIDLKCICRYQLNILKEFDEYWTGRKPRIINIFQCTKKIRLTVKDSLIHKQANTNKETNCFEWVPIVNCFVRIYHLFFPVNTDKHIMFVRSSSRLCYYMITVAIKLQGKCFYLL